MRKWGSVIGGKAPAVCPVCDHSPALFQEKYEWKRRMKMEQKFYICKHCGNIIAKVKDVGVPVVCCGEPMSEIIPNTTDAAVEKHLPVWSVENGIVHVVVSSVEHPMLPEHYIEWVSIHTRQGNQRKELHPGEKPEVCFAEGLISPEKRKPSRLQSLPGFFVMLFGGRTAAEEGCRPRRGGAPTGSGGAPAWSVSPATARCARLQGFGGHR